VKILLQQAYSRKNSGDGLLVDLTCALLTDAFGDELEIEVLANDSESFSDLKLVSQVQCVDVNFVARTIGSLKVMLYYFLALMRFSKFSYMSKECESSDLIVGVGGGYMRGKGFLDSVKSFINNTSQLYAATRSGKPVFYFPQSVGPYNCGLYHQFVTILFSRISYLYLRDDRSFNEFGVSSAKRAPDIAVMELAKSVKSIGGNFNKDTHSGKVVLVVRSISGEKEKKISYYKKLNYLLEKFNDCEVAIQSIGRGNDDHKFCCDLFGDSDYRTLTEVLSEGDVSVVISVRLHGALESMIQGVPAVHLSYERKGFGAFSDLGLLPYVKNAYDFDPDEVVRLVEGLLGSQNSYWDSVERNTQSICIARDEIIAELQGAFL
jgi:polysaccharide pyruvyl transferase WcaK-like protein